MILRPNHFQQGVTCPCSNINFKKLYFQSMLTLFGPFLGPNRSKWPKIAISLILRPNDFQRGVTCLCLNKISENGIFCIFSITWHFPTFPENSRHISRQFPTFPDGREPSGNVGAARGRGPYYVTQYPPWMKFRPSISLLIVQSNWNDIFTRSLRTC